MSGTQQDQRQADGDERATDFHEVIVGAGFPGLCMLHKLRDEMVSEIIRHMCDSGLVVVEPIREAEYEWVDHSQELAHATLFPESATWYMGANIPGEPQVFLPYLGGLGP